LYCTSRLIAELAEGRLITNFAQEGGFGLVLWAGAGDILEKLLAIFRLGVNGLP
jgi:predicted ATPase